MRRKTLSNERNLKCNNIIVSENLTISGIFQSPTTDLLNISYNVLNNK